jgi:hypothetical protein
MTLSLYEICCRDLPQEYPYPLPLPDLEPEPGAARRLLASPDMFAVTSTPPSDGSVTSSMPSGPSLLLSSPSASVSLPPQFQQAEIEASFLSPQNRPSLPPPPVMFLSPAAPFPPPVFPRGPAEPPAPPTIDTLLLGPPPAAPTPPPSP